MVTANSTQRQQIIERAVLEGVSPTIEEICELGIDVKFFAKRFAALKPLLDGLSGYKLLENWCEYWYMPDSWADMVEKAGLTGVQCLRFEEDDGTHQTSLLDTDPWSNLDIEVFLTRTGAWIVWARNDTRDVPPKFTTHNTIQSLVARFKQIAGEKYDFVSHGYYSSLHYYPKHQNGRHQVVSVALLLGIHLRELLGSSINEKERKLADQRFVEQALDDIQARAGLRGDRFPFIPLALYRQRQH